MCKAERYPIFLIQTRIALYSTFTGPPAARKARRCRCSIYFHGGGFASNTASARDGVELAVGNDMIVIMANYRLGVFGWLGLSGLDAETANHSS